MCTLSHATKTVREEQKMIAEYSNMEENGEINGCVHI